MLQSIILCRFLPELWRQAEICCADIPCERGYDSNNVFPDQTKLVTANFAHEEKSRNVRALFAVCGLLQLWRHEKSLAIDFTDGTEQDLIRENTSLDTHDVDVGHEISLPTEPATIGAAAWQ